MAAKKQMRVKGTRGKPRLVDPIEFFETLQEDEERSVIWKLLQKLVAALRGPA